MILQRDSRAPPVQSERRLQGHRQEVCGLKWSTDHQLLASGGNDNKVGLGGSHLPNQPRPESEGTGVHPKGGQWQAGVRPFVVPRGGHSCPEPHSHCRPHPQLLVWNHSSLSPVQQYTEHLAAVKAIAWSPHQHGLLASGGGTADRCIRFWNTLTGQPLQCIDTGSQVCNLAWSKHANELVSAGRGPRETSSVLGWSQAPATQVTESHLGLGVPADHQQGLAELGVQCGSPSSASHQPECGDRSQVALGRGAGLAALASWRASGGVGSFHPNRGLWEGPPVPTAPVHPQVSTHGYSQNQILVWKYPSLTQVAKLTGHSYRVLYLVSLHSWEGGVQIRPRPPDQGLGGHLGPLPARRVDTCCF